MNALTLSQMVAMTGGKLLAGDPQTVVTGVSTDSRKAGPGDLFIALRGDTFDGHQFVPGVASRVAAVLVADYPPELPPSCGVILVGDTLAGLQNLARHYRRQLACRVVGITGSNGKTSTKDLTAAVLAMTGPVCKTQGNLNNHIGLPLSVLSIGGMHQAAVLEMGMNHPGEIAPLAAIAAPDVAIITNIGVAHIEYLGSREGIAREKGMLVEAVGPGGTVILPADDDFTPALRQRARGRVLTAGFGPADVQVVDWQPGEDGSTFRLVAGGDSAEVSLSIPGRHMAGNAALAAAAGLSCGIPLAAAARALAGAELTGGRLQVRDVGGIRVIDDSYNANPDSMVAALDTLRDYPVTGRRIAVLGTMGELGDHAEEGYRRVGRSVAGLDLLLVVGDAACALAEEAGAVAGLKVLHVADAQAAASILKDTLREGDCMLVKGSRSARMERVIELMQPTSVAS